MRPEPRQTGQAPISEPEPLQKMQCMDEEYP
jgi:hypothetical protein